MEIGIRGELVRGKTLPLLRLDFAVGRKSRGLFSPASISIPS